MGSPYQTPLSPEDEAKFQNWAVLNGPRNQSPASKQLEANLPGSDYDARGLYKAQKPSAAYFPYQKADQADLTSPSGDGTIHGTDQFKTPYHNTTSNESQYATPNAPGWNSNAQLWTPGALNNAFDPNTRQPVSMVADESEYARKLSRDKLLASKIIPKMAAGGQVMPRRPMPPQAQGQPQVPPNASMQAQPMGQPKPPMPPPGPMPPPPGGQMPPPRPNPGQIMPHRPPMGGPPMPPGGPPPGGMPPPGPPMPPPPGGPPGGPPGVMPPGQNMQAQPMPPPPGGPGGVNAGSFAHGGMVRPHRFGYGGSAGLPQMPISQDPSTIGQPPMGPTSQAPGGGPMQQPGTGLPQQPGPGPAGPIGVLPPPPTDMPGEPPTGVSGYGPIQPMPPMPPPPPSGPDDSMQGPQMADGGVVDNAGQPSAWQKLWGSLMGKQQLAQAAGQPAPTPPPQNQNIDVVRNAAADAGKRMEEQRAQRPPSAQDSPTKKFCSGGMAGYGGYGR